MAAVRNMMQMSSSLLADVPSKVEFCRQRIAQVCVRAGLLLPGCKQTVQQADGHLQGSIQDQQRLCWSCASLQLWRRQIFQPRMHRGGHQPASTVLASL